MRKIIAIVTAVAVMLCYCNIPAYAADGAVLITDTTPVPTTSYNTYNYAKCTNTESPSSSTWALYEYNSNWSRCSLHTGTYSDGSTRYCEVHTHSYKCNICGAIKSYDKHDTGYYATYYYNAYGGANQGKCDGCDGYIKGYQCPYCNEKFGTSESTKHSCRYQNTAYGYYGTSSLIICQK